MDNVAVHLHYCTDLEPKHLTDILCGIEEEGIPFELFKVDQQDTREAGSEAARSSRLGVGLGINRQMITLHHEKTGTRPLFIEQWGDSKALRRIGANSARLIKGIPFLFPEDDQ